MTARTTRIGIATLLLVCAPALGCGRGEAREAAPAATKGVAPATATKKGGVGGSGFGESLSDSTPFVELADVLESPQAFDGKRVRTRGEVVAVCQAAGCWADLRPVGGTAASGPPTHVTMHDHAFLLPKTAKSRVAEVEGTLTVRALSQAECDHYNSEGASLVAGTPIVNVDAFGAVLR